MKVVIRHIRMSSRKINLVAGLVREKSVLEALSILKFAPRAAAGVMYKALHSAVSNAEHNDKKDPKNLVIDQIVINEGKTLKRGLPVSRGRWHRILKRSAHICIHLKDITDGVEEKVTAKKAKVEKSEKKVVEKKPVKKAESVKKAPKKVSKKTSSEK